MVATQQGVGAVQVCTGLAALVFLKPALDNINMAGSRSFLVFVIGVVGYVVPSGLDLFTTDYTLSVLTQTLTNCAGVLVGVAWLFLAFEVSNRITVTKPIVAGFGSYVLAGWLFTLLNPNNLVIMPSSHLVGTQLFLDSGPGFYLLLGIANIQVLVGTGLLATESFGAIGLRRRQTGLLALAIVPALITSVATGLMLRTPDISYGYDFTVFGWLGTLVMFAVALYSGRFLDVSSIARRRAFEDMSDPIVTLDEQNRVVDSNPAARSLVGVDGPWEGMPATEFFAPFPEQAEKFQSVETVDTDISIEHQGRKRHFSLSISPISGPQGEYRGRLIALREITLLKEREQKLDLMRQVQSRVLRHNIRNDMQVIRTTVKTATKQFDDEYAPIAESALETTDQLLSVSEKARAVEQLVDKEQTATTLDLSRTLSDIVDGYRDSFAEVSFTVDCPDSCYVETIPAIELAFANLIENGAEHNTGDDPVVTVVVETSSDEAVVTIRDNGPGIPDHEIAVIERAEETPLEHGTGIGLWVVQWVLDNTAGTVEYDTGDTGTTITIQLPRATDKVPSNQGS